MNNTMKPWYCIDIKIDEHEHPRGGTLVKDFEDESIYVSTGCGQCGNDPPKEWMCVEFKRFGLHVIGGKSMLDAIRGKEKCLWESICFEYVIASLTVDNSLPQLLLKMLENRRKDGYDQGRGDAQREMRVALGIELPRRI